MTLRSNDYMIAIVLEHDNHYHKKENLYHSIYEAWVYKNRG